MNWKNIKEDLKAIITLALIGTLFTLIFMVGVILLSFVKG